jgi:hypothetical protein
MLAAGKRVRLTTATQRSTHSRERKPHEATTCLLTVAAVLLVLVWVEVLTAMALEMEVLEVEAAVTLRTPPRL